MLRNTGSVSLLLAQTLRSKRILKIRQEESSFTLMKEKSHPFDKPIWLGYIFDCRCLQSQMANRIVFQMNYAKSKKPIFF